MKTSQFKQLIKESVREAIKEELKDILLEAIKAPKQEIKQEIKENLSSIGKSMPNTAIDQRAAYMDIIKNMSVGKDELSFNSNQFVPTSVNTAGEGTSLPPGEVSLDQILGLGLKV